MDNHSYDRGREPSAGRKPRNWLRGFGLTAAVAVWLAAFGLPLACTPDFGPLAAGEGAAGTTAGANGDGGTASTNGGSTAGTTPESGRGGATATAGNNQGAESGQGDSGAGDGGESMGGAGGSGVVSPVAEVVDVSMVWSGHPVPFALHTEGNRQFLAYYNPDRQMTIATRELGEPEWQTVFLPSVATWDSHEWIRLAFDEEKYIHVVGNMHDDPLTYFRTANPSDIASFQQINSMIGTNEASCTYPELFHDAEGKLVFTYRDGASGNGSTFVNRYDATSKTWQRLVGSALISGEGQRNAYPVGPTLGPDGYWHLVWVWRNNTDARTNHDLSYARSRDMVNWEKASGAPLTLPIRLSTADIVDPVPPGAGMINNNTKVGFDAENRVIVTYHKFDAAGATQLYNARFENGAWVPHQATRWSYRWDFGGAGTLIFEIEVEGVKALRDGTLSQRYFHAQEKNVHDQTGWGAHRLNAETLAAEALIEPPLPYPRELDAPESPTPGMASRWAADTGRGPDPDIYYMARWETLDSNRDLPRDVIPPPTQLRVYAFRYSAMSDGL